MNHMNASAKFEIRIALPVPEIIAIEVFGAWGCEPLILGEEEAVGVGDGIPFERALVSSCRPP